MILTYVSVQADEQGPFSWYDPTINATCYIWPDGSGDCYCACAPCLVIEKVVETPQPTVEPQPASKPACNRGLGNGAEDCDPGNSAGKPGAAGEDNE